MNCPRCGAGLEPTNIRELGLTYNAHTCKTCLGYWVGVEQLKDIEATVERRFVEFRRIPSEENQQRPLVCPQCEGGVKMNKVVNERDKKVIMDVCPQCNNIWLDGGEKDAIQEESLTALIVDCFRWSRDS